MDAWTAHYAQVPNSVTALRMAILVGRNARSYKFALAESLLLLRRQGVSELKLGELARLYATNIVERVSRGFTQAPPGTRLSHADFLTVAKRDSLRSSSDPVASEELVALAVRDMPDMVMTMFHHLPGGANPCVFYELQGRGATASVRLTQALLEIDEPHLWAGLNAEIQERRNLVETCWDAGVGASLVSRGAWLSADAQALVDLRLRRPVAQARQALSGFQAACFICMEPMKYGLEPLDVHHEIPIYWQRPDLRFTSRDLNEPWNLVVTHAQCNRSRSNALPPECEIRRLAERNERIAESPFPLAKVIRLTIGDSAPKRLAFHRRLESEVAARRSRRLDLQ